jgi:hypothetical protein
VHVVIGGTRERAEGEQAGQERGGGDMPPDLLEQDRGGDRAQAEAAALLVELHAHPALVDHRLPQGTVVPGVGRDRGAHALGRRQGIEEIACRALQRELILVEVEVHRCAPGRSGHSAAESMTAMS